MKRHFLDTTGLSHLWQRIREHFAQIKHEHTTGEITDIARVAVSNSYMDLDDGESIADKNWVEEKISEYEASFLTTQSGEIFNTEADLVGATENDFYLRGTQHTPNKSDWTIVREGEIISGITYSSRYMYDGTSPYSPNGWHFEVSYKMTLSNAQLAALNSGITSASYGGTAYKANRDGAGNTITSTYVNKNQLAQTTGESTVGVMSQKAVTDAITAEAQSRSEADYNLGQGINDLGQRLVSGLSDVYNNLSSSISDGLNSEAQARIDAINGEAQTRYESDQTLGTAIQNLGAVKANADGTNATGTWGKYSEGIDSHYTEHASHTYLKLGTITGNYNIYAGLVFVVNIRQNNSRNDTGILTIRKYEYGNGNSFGDTANTSNFVVLDARNPTVTPRAEFYTVSNASGNTATIDLYVDCECVLGISLLTCPKGVTWTPNQEIVSSIPTGAETVPSYRAALTNRTAAIGDSHIPAYVNSDGVLTAVTMPKASSNDANTRGYLVGRANYGASPSGKQIHQTSLIIIEGIYDNNGVITTNSSLVFIWNTTYRYSGSQTDTQMHDSIRLLNRENWPMSALPSLHRVADAENNRFNYYIRFNNTSQAQSTLQYTLCKVVPLGPVNAFTHDCVVRTTDIGGTKIDPIISDESLMGVGTNSGSGSSGQPTYNNDLRKYNTFILRNTSTTVARRAIIVANSLIEGVRYHFACMRANQSGSSSNNMIIQLKPTVDMTVYNPPYTWGASVNANTTYDLCNGATKSDLTMIRQGSNLYVFSY